MNIVLITVTLLNGSPKVARVLELPHTMTLDWLHRCLQAAFGWQEAHLYQFSIGEPYQYGAKKWVMPEFAEDQTDMPSDQTTLGEALGKAGAEGLTYLYDFGDDWEHVIEVGDPIKPDARKTYPRLTHVEGACPPEDIGGAPGYEIFLEAMRDPKHPDHKEFKGWYGGVFDPHAPKERSLKTKVTKVAKLWANYTPVS